MPARGRRGRRRPGPHPERSARRGAGAGGRERLLAAATELFAERGYAATGTAEVCRRAGVAKTALYWHFESKEGLLAEVIRTVGTSWIEEIEKRIYLEGDAEERICRLMAELRRLLDEQPELLRLPMVAGLEQGEASEQARDALRTVWRRAEEALTRGIEDTLGQTLPDLDLVAHTVVTLLEGAMLRQAVDPDPVRLDRLLAELQRTVVLLIADRLPPETAGPLLEGLSRVRHGVA